MPRKKRTNVVGGETPDDQLGRRFYGNMSFFQTALTQMGTYGRDNNRKFAIISKEMEPLCLWEYTPASYQQDKIVKLFGKTAYLLRNGYNAIHMAIIRKDANETPSDCISKCRWVDAPIIGTLNENGLAIDTYEPNHEPGVGLKRGVFLIYYFPFSEQNLTSHLLYNFTKFDMYSKPLMEYEQPLMTTTYQIPDSDLETGVEWRIRKFFSGQVECDAHENRMQGTFILDTWFDSGHLDLTKDEGMFLLIDKKFCNNTLFYDATLRNEIVLQLFNEEILMRMETLDENGNRVVLDPYHLKWNPTPPHPYEWKAESMNVINVLPIP